MQNDDQETQLISDCLNAVGKGRWVLSRVCETLSATIDCLQEPGAFHLLLLDLLLPDSKGLNALRKISKAAHCIPIILLNRASEETPPEIALREGAHSYLDISDLTGRNLIRAIECAIGRKRSETELQTTVDELEHRMEVQIMELHRMQRINAIITDFGQTQSRTVRQSRLHSLERMANGIAHDFNNALSPILAYAEWALMKPEVLQNETKVQHTLVKIHESARLCADLMSRLRDFYRRRDEMARLGEIDLAQLADEAIRLTEPCWNEQAQEPKKAIRVEKAMADVSKIVGSASEIREMLTNLLLNSIEAIREEGVIRVSVFMEAGRVCVRIGDNGEGMSEEVAESCIEPFFTTKHGLGSGLGLGVVYGIAQRHEAEIIIESELGAGTQITVLFPPCSERQLQEQLLEQMEPVYGLRILAADDERTINEVLSVYLNEDSHQAVFTSGGAEALEKMEAGEFDLLVTDQAMPGMNGAMLAEAARAKNPKIRVLLLTAVGDLADSESSPEPVRNVDAIVKKPFTFESLRRGIAKAMRSEKRMHAGENAAI